MNELLYLSATILGFLAFFEPCTIATHTLFSASLNQMQNKQRTKKLLQFIFVKSISLSILLVLLTVFIPHVEWNQNFLSIFLSVIASIYIITRYIYIPIPHIELYKLIPTRSTTSQAIKLALTLPACTIPLFIIIVFMSLKIDTLTFATMSGIIFAIFFTIPVIFYSFRGISEKAQKFLSMAAKTTPYITAILLYATSFYLIIHNNTINIQTFQNTIMEINYAAIILVFLAGFIFSFNPVTLSSIAVIVAYMTKKSESKPSKYIGLAFIIGLILTHIFLGFLAVLTGGWVKTFMGKHWELVFAPILIILGLISMGLINIRIPWFSFKGRKATNIFAALLLSIPFTLGICPFCSPIILVILTSVAAINSYLYAIIMMLVFALGRSIIVALSIWGTSEILSLNFNPRIQKTLEIISGSVFIIVGCYFLNDFFNLLSL